MSGPGESVLESQEAFEKRQKADLRWLNKAEHWGEWVRFSETEAADPESIWMMRGGNGNVRFYAKGRGQQGPEHKSVVAATAWAWANRWLWKDEDGTLDIGGQLACRKWVLAGGAALDKDNAPVNMGEHRPLANARGQESDR